ncbi:MAG: ParB/RepB/Spo0J family partition protein [Bacilli bacterium]|nr:ParB/RepB/Spo0J family partition protein [Bacilli bacterium]
MENKKRALGRGLEQLFNNENLDVETLERRIYETSSNEEIIEVPIDELRPNPYQPRKVFDESAIQELAESIKEHGVFQPIIVKKSVKGYEIVAGERRFRASKLVGLKKIPAIIRNFTDEQMMEIGLLENLQRENLNPIEEADAYNMMLNNLNLTQDELSKKVGKSRSYVTNMLGLLRLPKSVQEMVANSSISMGHARVLSKLSDTEKIISLANEIVDKNLTVRDLEYKLSDNESFQRIQKQVKKEKNNDYKYVEDILRDKLDTRVKIKDKKIEIIFTSVADLNRILEILNVKE